MSLITDAVAQAYPAVAPIVKGDNISPIIHGSCLFADSANTDIQPNKTVIVPNPVAINLSSVILNPFGAYAINKKSKCQKKIQCFYC